MFGAQNIISPPTGIYRGHLCLQVIWPLKPKKLEFVQPWLCRLHHPLIVAEEIATADLLSNGRLDIGLGRGYQVYEFERLGMKLEESRERFEEAVDILLLAFKGEPFSFNGKHFKFGETSIFPTPVQKPRPPIWVVGQSEESIVATAKRGFNLVSGGFGVSLERLKEFRKSFDDLLVDAEQKENIRVSTQRAVYVTNDESELPEIIEQARWNMRVTLSLRQGLERWKRTCAGYTF